MAARSRISTYLSGANWSNSSEAKLLAQAVPGLPALPDKKIGFRSATPQPKPDADRRISALLLSSNRARQFIFLATAYLIQATKLPRDFERELETRINELYRLDTP